MLVPYAEWAPDQAQLNSALTGDVMNVLCAAGSYIPFPMAAVFAASLESEPLGYFRARTLAGQVFIFALTADKIFLLNNTDLTWDDVSQTGVTYSATADAQWSLTQFGEYVVAVNRNDDPQVFQLGVSSEFADLAGSPPRANKVRVWGDFLVLEQLTSNLNRVQWSAINDIETWTPGVNNSDYQDFSDGGAVQGSSEATNPVIILESAIYVGTFIPGSVEVFSFTKVHDKRGAASANSIASRGSFIFYADEGGFFQIGSDGSLGNIGFEKVDRTYFGQLAASDIANIRGVVDPFYSRVYWALDIGSVGYFNRLLIFDWNLGRWSQATVAIRGHFPAATTGFTLESLDNVSASLDALPFSLDSKVWQGGAPLLAAFNTNNELVFFNGEAAEATITTQEMGDTAGQVTFIRDVYPITDTASIFVSTGSRLRRTDPIVWTGEKSPSASTGKAMGRSRGRFHRFKTRIPAGTDWSHAQGVDVQPKPMGMR
jgi:hypothetical protein